MRLQSLTPEQLDAHQKQLYESILSGPRASSRARLVAPTGSLRGPFDPMLRSPQVGSHIEQLGAALRFKTEIRPDLREFAILLTALHWRSDFEWDEHVPLAITAGLDHAIPAELRSNSAPVLRDPALRAVYQALQELFGDKKLSDRGYKSLREHFSEPQCFEIFALVGYYSLLALIMNGFGIEAE